jgi:hypothetical protein
MYKNKGESEWAINIFPEVILIPGRCILYYLQF